MEVSIPPKRYARHYSAEVKTGLRGKFAINFVVAMCLLVVRSDSSLSSHLFRRV
jgi:hypothetical protein